MASRPDNPDPFAASRHSPGASVVRRSYLPAFGMNVVDYTPCLVGIARDVGAQSVLILQSPFPESAGPPGSAVARTALPGRSI